MGNEYRLHVSEPWYTHIKSGLKTVEGRQKGGEIDGIAEDDNIIFWHEDLGEFKTKVTRVSHYESLEDYVAMEGPSKVTPGFNSINDSCNIYLRYYTLESIKSAGGMSAIEIQII